MRTVATIQETVARLRRATPSKVRNFALLKARRGLRRIGIGPAPWYRKLRTKNYRSRYLAFGEQNIYDLPPQWVTVDWEGADFNIDVVKAKRLPFPDRSFDYIYSSHMIEHIPDETLAKLLHESFRILDHGGIIRLEAPDCQIVSEAYKNNDEEFMRYFQDANALTLVRDRGKPALYCERHIAFIGIMSCYVETNRHVPVIASREEVDQRIRSMSLDDFGKWAVSLQTPEQYRSGGHVNVLYFDKVKAHLERAGFTKIERAKPGKSRAKTPKFLMIERPHRHFFSFIVEAEKP